MPDQGLVPLEFELPNHSWKMLDEAKAAEYGAAFMAFGPKDTTWFTPNITITGEYREDDRSLEQLADDAVAGLSSAGRNVQLTDRVATEATEDEDATITQWTSLMVDVEGSTYGLRQVQTLMELRDQDAPQRRAIYAFSMMAPDKQIAELLPDFEKFLRSVRVAEAA